MPHELHITYIYCAIFDQCYSERYVSRHWFANWMHYTALLFKGVIHLNKKTKQYDKITKKYCNHLSKSPAIQRRSSSWCSSLCLPGAAHNRCSQWPQCSHAVILALVNKDRSACQGFYTEPAGDWRGEYSRTGLFGIVFKVDNPFNYKRVQNVATSFKRVIYFNFEYKDLLTIAFKLFLAFLSG